MRQSSPHAGPYQSAFDLPSFRELLDQVRGGKLITRVAARKQHQDFKALEAKVRRLGETVDKFYDLLGDRNWIFHDSLDVSKVEEIFDAGLCPDDAEARFIGLYRDDLERRRFMVRTLRRFPELQSRMSLIERALEDYEAGRYHAVVLALLPVMEGS